MKLSKHVTDMMAAYGVEPEDVAFAELRANGWGENEAAFYAYHLAYSDTMSIAMWIKKHHVARPGIQGLVSELKTKVEARASKLKKSKEFEERVNEEVLKRMGKATSSKKADDDDAETMTKEELGKMYIRIMRSDADDKTKMEASKSYTQLYQLHKEQNEEEDNRLIFHLSHNCHYCDRCKTCELKTELEQRGCRIRAKRTSPYIWEIEKDDNTNNNSNNENQ